MKRKPMTARIAGCGLSGVLVAGLLCVGDSSAQTPRMAQQPARRFVLVQAASVESVSPDPVVPGEPLRVDLVVKLGAQIARHELIAVLEVRLDGRAAARVPQPQPGPPATAQSPYPLDPNPQARLPAGDPRKITLVVIAPSPLPADREIALSIFSKPDDREIAAMPVRVAGSPLRPDQVPVSPVTPGQGDAVAGGVSTWVIVGGVGFVAFVLGLVAWRQRRAASEQRLQAAARIRELESTVLVERQRVRELARSGQAADSQAASSAGASPPRLPPEVSAALERRDLVLVLGPGVSAQSGLPTSRELWLHVLHRAASRIPESQLDSLRALIVKEGAAPAIEAIVSLVGQPDVLTALSDELLTARAQPSRFHELLAALPVPAVLDTNWDDLMPRALAKAGRPVEQFGPGRPEGISEALRTGRLVLIKPRGDLREPTSVVLTARDYRRMLNQAPELERSIAALYSNRTLLFFGFSLRGLEQFLTSLPAELESTGRMHFAVVPAAPEAEIWQAGLGRRFGVTVVGFRPSGEYRELVVAAEALAEKVAGAAGSAPDAQLPAGSSRLTYLALESIGIFRRLRLEFSPGWTLLLGNNGGGKSTILRASALALAGNDSRAAVAASRLLRTGSKSGMVELGIGSRSLVTMLVLDGPNVLVKSPQTTVLQAGQTLVLAFPALRGVATRQVRGPTNAPAPNPSVDDVAPMLEGVVDGRLDNLHQWVVNTALRAEKDPGGRDAKMLATFKDLIARMVPGGGVDYVGVDRTTWQVILSVDKVNVPFDGVSQGMSSILNWIGLLLQRLYDVYPRSKSPEREPAIVLIDEIDAHLHPKWQRRLVSLTREHFPNVQFIASSHSPLLAGAVQRSEVRVVAKDEDSGEMEARIPPEDVSGQKAEDIYVSSLFSMETTRSTDAQNTIHRYFELFHKSSLSPADQQELDELSIRLQALNYGPTIAQRQVMDQVRQQVDRNLESISADDVRAFKRRLASGASETPRDGDVKGGEAS